MVTTLFSPQEQMGEKKVKEDEYTSMQSPWKIYENGCWWMIFLEFNRNVATSFFRKAMPEDA